MNEKITELIEQLAAKLGTTVDLLWAALIRQAYIQATYSTICFLLAVGYLIAFGIACRYVQKSDVYDDSTTETLLVGGGVLSIPAIMLLFVLPYRILTGYFNPEYWALQKILEQL